MDSREEIALLERILKFKKTYGKYPFHDSETMNVFYENVISGIGDYPTQEFLSNKIHELRERFLINLNRSEEVQDSVDNSKIFNLSLKIWEDEYIEDSFDSKKKKESDTEDDAVKEMDPDFGSETESYYPVVEDDGEFVKDSFEGYYESDKDGDEVQMVSDNDVVIKSSPEIKMVNTNDIDVVIESSPENKMVNATDNDAVIKSSPENEMVNATVATSDDEVVKDSSGSDDMFDATVAISDDEVVKDSFEGYESDKDDGYEVDQTVSDNDVVIKSSPEDKMVDIDVVIKSSPEIEMVNTNDIDVVIENKMVNTTVALSDDKEVVNEDDMLNASVAISDDNQVVEETSEDEDEDDDIRL